jgi:hypothetical protein
MRLIRLTISLQKFNLCGVAEMKTNCRLLKNLNRFWRSKIMGLFSKNKGKRGEREVAKELQRVLNVRAGRGVQFKGGPESPDVLIDIPEIHIECKRVERFNLYESLEQASKQRCRRNENSACPTSSK